MDAENVHLSVPDMQQFTKDSLLEIIHKIYPLLGDTRPAFALGKRNKSNAKSGRLQNSGKVVYNRRTSSDDFLARCYNALNEYSASVAWADPAAAVEDNRPNTLADAYRRRSVVLFDLQMYEQCLLDVNRALEDTEREYSASVIRSLTRRRDQCLEKIREANYEIAAEETNPIRVTNEIEESEWTVMSDPSHLNHPLLERTSPKIKLERRENWGRCMVANDDIQPGDILSIEKYFVSVLINDKRYKNCSHCLCECYALIPCESCNWMMYCSETCREEANRLYHAPFECRMKFTGPSIWDKCDWKMIKMLAVRALLIGTENGCAGPPGGESPLEKLMKEFPLVENVFNETPNQKGIDDRYESNYESVLRMSQEFKTTLEFHDKVVWYALDLMIQLRRLNFFENSATFRLSDNYELPANMNDAQFFVTLVLLNHLYTFRNNFYRIAQVDKRETVATGSHRLIVDEVVAFAVCPLHTVINHSCNPNARSFARERDHVIVAMHPIRKNEQIFVNYGHPFWSHNIKERTDFLTSTYNFTCQCDACNHDWPNIEALLDRTWPEIVNDYFSNCSTSWDLIRQVQARTEEIVAAIDLGAELNNSEIRRKLSRFISMLYNELRMPAAPTVFCQDFLWRFMLLTYCNFHKQYRPLMKCRVTKRVQQLLTKIDSFMVFKYASAPGEEAADSAQED